LKIYTKSISSKETIKIYSQNPFKDSANTLSIGNKAQSLLKLHRLGYCIPNSVILDYSFFNEYQKHHTISSELITQVIDENLGNTIAVRSSCNLEDSVSQSFAGAFKTSLNVSNSFKELEIALIECYKSIDNPRVLEILKRRKIDRNSLQMAIIIQSMIEAKISGIIFTVPPLNPTETSYRIEYCSGSGDRLTGGQVTGNSIILDKHSGKIIQQEGNLFLSKSQIDHLWHEASQLEKDFRFPQDVEFVISQTNHEPFLVQSRPITAFTYTPEYVIPNENEKIKEIFEADYQTYGEFPILSHNNISELFPTAIPLGYSIFKTIFAGTRFKKGAIAKGRGKLGYASISKAEQTRLFLTVGNQARVNLLMDALTFHLKGIDKKIYLNKLVRYYLEIMRNDFEKANYPEFEVYLQSPSQEECEKFFRAEGLKYYKVYATFFEKLQTEKAPAILGAIEATLERNDAFYERELSLTP